MSLNSYIIANEADFIRMSFPIELKIPINTNYSKQVSILPIPSAPPVAQIQILFALDVHEHDSAGQAHRHHDQLGPEGPSYQSTAHFLGSPFDEHTEGPYHTQGSGTVEQDRTEKPPPFNPRHLQTSPL